MICGCRRNRSSSTSRELARGRGRDVNIHLDWNKSVPSTRQERHLLEVTRRSKRKKKKKEEELTLVKLAFASPSVYALWLRKKRMASRNTGGGSQGLSRQSSVATTSGSVMKSRQVVSFVFERLFLCSASPFSATGSRIVVSNQTDRYIYTDTFTFSVGSVVQKFIGYGKFVEDDECAG